ncbi:hypothetical protein N792_12380 [Lysobacter concretionis Ko07 = DSM 16239]|uniref:Glycosyltransferase RgtA/B/C/D-like domain-containing protein n=1 Tax=Lysobacter concretionis Ko07 = DSM 16239 TaxID=1122185 RepID=A0A0A0ELE4_9GAMM|nr:MULTISPECIES: hypothetical protein [Lysobacter]KGM51179.1 hypothetical protein N792_12380 [Lysobacter concretionis Ko07 = DSM 16239]QOD90835.1 hypothetical protein H2514_11755 [Lysobacter sp. CW239]
MPDPAAPRARLLTAQATIWAGVAACVSGLALHRFWQVLPGGRFAESLAIATIVSLVAWSLRRWRGGAWADALAAVWLLMLVALTGVLPALAVAALVGAAISVGSLLTGPARPLLACLAGLALIAALVGWTLPLPLHRWWVYLPLLLLTIIWRRRALHEQLQCGIAGWLDAVRSAPRAAAWTVLALGLASTGAWLPTMQHDDLAYHLGLPWQLMLHGRYALDPAHQVWALAPWAGDVLQAVPQVLAHAEARSALNLVWLIASAAGLCQIGAHIGLRPALRWATVALFASLPMTAGLLSGMQTETPATAVTIALALLVLDKGEVRRRLWIGALLFVLLCSLKLMHGLAALPLLAWAGWRHRDRLAIKPLAGAALLVLMAGGSSFIYAWLVAGNPVLPLFNGMFQSPYFAALNFDDGRWHAGFSPGLPWNLTFNTARYLEGWNGGMGFVLVALAGAWLLALFDKRARGLTICASLAMVLPLVALQYGRYVHPGMVLLLPALLLAIQRWLPLRAATCLIVATCLLNLAFQANSHWLLHVGGAKRSLATLGNDEALFTRYAPERVIAAAIRERAPDSGAVLVLSNPYYAEFAGRGRTISWYAPDMQAQGDAADADATGAAWAQLLGRSRIGELIVSTDGLTAARRAGLERTGARLELTVGDAQWWRMPAASPRPQSP